MDRTTLAYALLACLPVLVFIIWCTLSIRARLARALASRRARKRARRALDGEARAEVLLASLGYAIEERQARCAWTIFVDGEAREIPLRADLLVSRAGRMYVAEVKTGKAAPRLATAATRRQLLEYRLAYPDVVGVLLVDAESSRVMTVQFPRVDDLAGPRPGRIPTNGTWLWLTLVWLSGLATGALAL